MRTLYLLISLLVPLASQAAINDVLPGDCFPLPPGQTTLAVYAFDRKLNGPYVDGHKLLDGEIDSQVLSLRAAHLFQVGSTTLAGMAVIPWSNSLVTPAPLATALGRKVKGVGDLRLGLPTWLINDITSANYLGVSGTFVAPTGDYNARQPLNPDENRWRFTLSAGWQKGITPEFLIELSPEIAWYGVNDDYVGNRKFEQRTSYALTGYLRWRISQACMCIWVGRSIVAALLRSTVSISTILPTTNA